MTETMGPLLKRIGFWNKDWNPCFARLQCDHLFAAMLFRSALHRDAEKANHQNIGNKASCSSTDCTTPMANDAKRVANTQDPTAKRRLRAERERAHRNRIKSCSVFPEQPLSLRDLICGFVANQREEWDSLPEYVRVRDYFGGHQFSGVREELGFGFMVEDVHYGICRIWSRAWLNRGHPIKPFRYSNSN